MEDAGAAAAEASSISVRISVVIAAYESASTIADTVESALEQEPPPVEVIVVDDGSTDDLPSALGGFGDAVTLLRRPHRGEAAAKNAGVRAAHGEWVAILDADDRFLPGRLAALARLAAARPDLDLLTTDAYLELDGQVVGRCYHAGHRFATSDQRRAILERNFVFGQVLVKRERLLEIGGFDESIPYTTDWDCWIRLLLAGARAGLVDEPLAVYRMHEAAMSADRVAMYEGRVLTLTKTLHDPRLSAGERRLVADRLAEEQARTDLEGLRAALLCGDAGARRRALAIVRSRAHPVPARVKAAAAVIAPGLVASRLRARDRRHWVGVGDRRFRRT